MWQQARARTSNSEARLLILLDCPSAGSWVQQLQQVPAAAAFATGIAVQASCEAGHMAWSHAAPAQPGGVFTSWYTQASAHGESPWSLLPNAVPSSSSTSCNPLPHPAQVRGGVCVVQRVCGAESLRAPGVWARVSRRRGEGARQQGRGRAYCVLCNDAEGVPWFWNALVLQPRCHAWGVNSTIFQRGVPSCAWAARSTCPASRSLARAGSPDEASAAI